MEEEIISIRIGGLEYKLQCPVEEQPHLLEAAEKLDKKIKLDPCQTIWLSNR